MELMIIAPAQVEPVTLEEAKQHLRVDIDEENSLILSLISAAREYCENFTGRALAVQGYEAYLDAFPAGSAAIQLPLLPVKRLDSLTYRTNTGQAAFLLENQDFVLRQSQAEAKLQPVFGKVWTAGVNITIQFTAGYDSLSGPVKQAILLLTGHFYERREAVTISGGTAEMPFAVSSLLWPYRVIRW